MQFERRKADLGIFKERAEALQRAVTILEEGIAASRAQVCSLDTYARLAFWLLD